MTDIVSPAVRSRMMAGIGSRNTAPEITLRKALHARGIRFRLHGTGLPGRPDIVLRRFNAVIFVHGCFWHVHGDRCRLSKRPSTNTAFWDEKLLKNQDRDRRTAVTLLEAGWRVCTIWECSTRGRSEMQIDQLAAKVIRWLQSDLPRFDSGFVSKVNP